MKTVYQTKQLKVVDNEHDYDFVGYIKNLTDKRMVVIFQPGDSTFDEEKDEDIWDEEDWNVESISFSNDDDELRKLHDFVEENKSFPSFLEMIEIEPHNWGGFLADNKGRSMFNALKKLAA